jgi:hypothetical protein
MLTTGIPEVIDVCRHVDKLSRYSSREVVEKVELCTAQRYETQGFRSNESNPVIVAAQNKLTVIHSCCRQPRERNFYDGKLCRSYKAW